MARKKTRSLAGKKFFSLVVLSVSALGLLFTANYALQQQTSTEGQAYTCKSKPNINIISTRGYSKSVVYRFDIKNVNSRGCSKNPIKYAMKITNKPDKNWNFTFAYAGDNFSENINFSDACRDGRLARGETDGWKLRVIPSTNAKKGTYYFKLHACQGKTAASQRGDDICSYDPTTNCTTKTLKYVKD